MGRLSSDLHGLLFATPLSGENMKSIFTLMTLMALSWGSFAQACPCVDQETLTINQRYHEAGLLVDNAALPRLQSVDLIALVKASIVQHQAKIQELQAMSVNAGIPYRPSDLSQGFTDRGAQEIPVLAALSGSALDDAYITFRSGELQRLLTAFDTYFSLEVETPTMKAWVPGERAIISQEYNQSAALQTALTQ
jgi:hypothetical protein